MNFFTWAADNLFMKARLLICLLSAMILCSAFPQPAFANPGTIVRGIGKLLFSAFEIPKAMLTDSAHVPFPLGIVTGAVSGTFRTVMGTVGGAVDVATGSAPYAKYAVLFV